MATNSLASDATRKMNTVTLKSSDEILFEVPENVARQSKVINRQIEEMKSEAEGTCVQQTVVPVPVVTAEVLKKVITYCERHAETAGATKGKKAQEGNRTRPASDELPVVPVTVVTTEVPKKVITYCEKHAETADATKTKKAQEGSSTRLVPDEPAVVPVLVANAEVPKKVITYCDKHAKTADATKTTKSQEASSTSPASGEELDKWDKQFVDVDQAMLYDLLMAAYSLQIDGLVDLTCQKVADMIERKNPEEIRQVFHIQYNFTSDEEEQMHRENQWAFD